MNAHELVQEIHNDKPRYRTHQDIGNTGKLLENGLICLMTGILIHPTLRFSAWITALCSICFFSVLSYKRLRFRPTIPDEIEWFRAWPHVSSCVFRKMLDTRVIHLAQQCPAGMHYLEEQFEELKNILLRSQQQCIELVEAHEKLMRGEVLPAAHSNTSRALQSLADNIAFHHRLISELLPFYFLASHHFGNINTEMDDESSWEEIQHFESELQIAIERAQTDLCVLHNRDSHTPSKHTTNLRMWNNPGWKSIARDQATSTDKTPS